MRVTNLVIGTTTLAVIAAAFVGMLSVQKMRGAQQRSPLRIVFNGSASGLRRGGPVDFDGVPAGEIKSIKLESPRKIVALVTLDKSAPIRADTAVGIEFQGLTGVAAISLVGGAAGAPPVQLDQDGVPVLTADWSEQQSITDTLHNVDRIIIDNQQSMNAGLRSFENYTAALKTKSQAVDSAIDQAENAFTSIDNAVAKIGGLVPGLADGRPEELFEKVKSLRELADSFRQKSATAMEEGRRTLLDISQAAGSFDRKFEPRAAGVAPRPPHPPRPQDPNRR